MEKVYVHKLTLSRSEEQLLRMKKEAKAALNALRKTGLSNKDFISGIGNEYITGCIKLHKQMIADIDKAIAVRGNENRLKEAKRIQSIQIEIFGLSHNGNQDQQSDTVKRFIEYAHHHVQSAGHIGRAASNIRGAYMRGELSEAMFLTAQAIYRDENRSDAIEAFNSYCDQKWSEAAYTPELAGAGRSDNAA